MGLIDVVPIPQALAAKILVAESIEFTASPNRKHQRQIEVRNADGADGDTAELLVYSEIGANLFGDGFTAKDLAGQLSAVTARNLTVRLNSPGGSVWEGLSMANLLRDHPARVTVLVDGIAASVASVIAMAGDEIVMMPQSQMMIHDAIGVTYGNPADHREMADLLDRQSDNIAAAYRDRAGGRIDTWRNRMRAETWYMGEEAVKAGLADRMAPAKRKSAPDENEPDMAARTSPTVWDLSVFRYQGRDAAPDPMAEPVAEPVAEPTSAGIVPLELDTIRAVVRSALGVVDTACPSHDTGAEEGTWSKSENEGRLPSPMPVGTAKRFYGAYDADRVEDGKIPKDAGHLPHHFVSGDGTPGKASVAGVRAALARLGQTHGLTPEERDAVERHLRGHLPSDDGADDRADPPEQTPEPPARRLTLGRARPDDKPRPRRLVFGTGGGQHQ